MIMQNDIVSSAAKQLADDLNCSAEDFFKTENTVTNSLLRDGRRIFRDAPDFFRAATMGMSAVITADNRIAPFAEMAAKKYSGTELFSAAAVAEINRELFSCGYMISGINQYYLPRVPYHPSVRHDGFMLSVFEEKDISSLYGFNGFDNALMHKSEGERRDILAVCAVNGRNVVGIAGASNDSRRFAQIGIDVLPDFRCMGIGSALVAAAANEVFRSGYIPYYGTWSGNIFSQRLAAKCSFYPAWCEMYASEIIK